MKIETTEQEEEEEEERLVVSLPKRPSLLTVRSWRYRISKMVSSPLDPCVDMWPDGTKLEMVVEGLTGHNSQEDAVLAVAATSSDSNGDGHRIWVGTRSGRCFLYRLCNSDDPSSSRPVAPLSSSSCWKLEWQVRLPYAVNGIWLRDNDVVVDDARQKRVIVTTSRGIHIFRTVHSAVQQARNRLSMISIS
jgi:hypothetical protein